jgi:hypothetical protein
MCGTSARPVHPLIPPPPPPQPRLHAVTSQSQFLPGPPPAMAMRSTTRAHAVCCKPPNRAHAPPPPPPASLPRDFSQLHGAVAALHDASRQLLAVGIVKEQAVLLQAVGDLRWRAMGAMCGGARAPSALQDRGRRQLWRWSSAGQLESQGYAGCPISEVDMLGLRWSVAKCKTQDAAGSGGGCSRRAPTSSSSTLGACIR